LADKSLSSYARYAIEGIGHVIENFGPRDPGSEGEKLAQEFVLFRIPGLELPFPSTRAVIKAKRYTGSGPQTGADEDYSPLRRGDDNYIVSDYALLEAALPQANALLPWMAIEPKDSEGNTVDDIASLIIYDGGLSYHLRYKGGAMAGCDPTIMGIGPIYAVRKLLDRFNLTPGDIDVVELNEAFASQALACLRELGFEENAPFKKTNLWGGALALGHPLGESGARIVITLNNIMKKDLPDARYGLAALCGGFGNANATLWEKV